MQGVTAEYGPARAQKNQTGKWYPQIPVDHTTLQINQRVVNTTLIPVKYKHWSTTCAPATWSRRTSLLLRHSAAARSLRMSAGDRQAAKRLH